MLGELVLNYLYSYLYDVDSIKDEHYKLIVSFPGLGKPGNKYSIVNIHYIG